MLVTASLQPGARICHLADLFGADERRGNVFGNQVYGCARAGSGLRPLPTLACGCVHRACGRGC